jgi:hypothetical protein
LSNTSLRNGFRNEAPESWSYFDLCRWSPWSVDSLASVAFVSLCIEEAFWLLLSKNPLRLTIPIYSKNISKIRKVIAIFDMH